ncbi:hypothetical protein ROE7235_02121 [Roseibaca ekhonensis]|uniref:Uncharacterized protein n=1 Tax=Roseinatronobacter ekhonensis TaxID=254356 RepID=A0A3B0M8V2_9RHOB|nr:hypothetical protein [Roseibaca ekhonensis]SUZ32365.1 hypothetical protein ROE7235_02121 [Roseibaca ekhonensis]
MHDFAYLTMTASEDAQCHLMLNGLPILHGPRGANLQWMDILNLRMKRHNTLEIEIAAEPGQHLDAMFRLSRHAPGTVMAPDTGIGLRAEIRDATGAPIPQEPDGRFTLSGPSPFRAELRFESFGPDFTHRLEPAAALPSSLAQEMGLTALRALEARNIDQILTMMTPLLEDIVIVWQDPLSTLRDEIRQGFLEIADGLPERGLDYALSTQQLGPLVRVMRDGGALFQSMDRTMRMEATFGLVDGQVMILR